MSGDEHRQPGPILGQIPHLQRPAKLPDEWHCKQLPFGANPIVVCERADMLAEVERLRAEVKSLTTEITYLWIPSAEKWMEDFNRLRAAGDALAEWMLMAPRSDLAHELVAAWEEARRER